MLGVVQPRIQLVATDVASAIAAAVATPATVVAEAADEDEQQQQEDAVVSEATIAAVPATIADRGLDVGERVVRHFDSFLFGFHECLSKAPCAPDAMN